MATTHHTEGPQLAMAITRLRGIGLGYRSHTDKPKRLGGLTRGSARAVLQGPCCKGIHIHVLEMDRKLALAPLGGPADRRWEEALGPAIPDRNVDDSYCRGDGAQERREGKE